MTCIVNAMTCIVNAMTCIVNAVTCIANAMTCIANASTCNFNAVFFTSHWLGEVRAIAIRCHLVVILLDNAFATISLRQVKTRPIF
ncbi:hypothetical protein ACEYW6_05280 [Nostoc sp. UIC 10607]